MADKAAHHDSMDPQTTINEVVNSVKSEGLFDQFRKECLEEFENMETYYQLKQSVENHVASFLAKHKFHDGLQKNSLRNDLRSYISKSEVLLNSIQRLVDEVLSRKGHSFCLKIDKQVDKFLNTNHDEEPKNADEASSSQESLNTNEDTAESSTSQDSEIQTSTETSQFTSSEILTTQVQAEDVNCRTEENIVTEIEEVEMQINDEKNVNEDEKNEDIIEKTINKSEVAQESRENCLENVASSIEKEVDNHEKITDDTKDLDEDVNSPKTPCLDESPNERVEIMVNEEEKVESKESYVIKKDEVGLLQDNIEAISEEEEEEEEEEEKKEEKEDEEEDGVKKHEIEVVPSAYYSGLQTEPISDESTTNSNDSSYDQISETSENNIDDKNIDENDSNLRKSSRVRTVPLKLRAVKDKKDDCESISSNDAADLKDVSDTKHSRSRSRKYQQQTKEKSKEKPVEESRTSKRERSHVKEQNVKTENKRNRSPSTNSKSRSLSHSKRNRGESSSDNASSTARSNKRGVSPNASNSRSSKRGVSPGDNSSNSRSSKRGVTRTVASPEHSSKRSRRPTKQRQRYSPS